MHLHHILFCLFFKLCVVQYHYKSYKGSKIHGVHIQHDSRSFLFLAPSVSSGGSPVLVLPNGDPKVEGFIDCSDSSDPDGTVVKTELVQLSG